MENQRAYIQIIISVLVIAVLFAIVLTYLSGYGKNTESIFKNDSFENNTSSDSFTSPKSIIEGAKEKIDNIEDKKNTDIEEYLDYLEDF